MRANPEVPEELRGTYAGLTSPAALAHLKSLGVTAVELLPVYHRSPTADAVSPLPTSSCSLAFYLAPGLLRCSPIKVEASTFCDSSPGFRGSSIKDLRVRPQITAHRAGFAIGGGRMDSNPPNIAR